MENYEIVEKLNSFDGIVFKKPSNILIFGGTGSGKTFFTQQLLLNKHIYFSHVPEKIIVFYKEYQPIYNELKEYFGENIKFILGVENDIISKISNAIVVYDDCLSSINNDILTNFYAGCQHRGLINIFLSQSIYFGENLKNIRRIANYFIFLNSVEKASIFRLISNYLDGKELDLFRKSFNKVMLNSDYSHVIFDLHPRTKQITRFKFDIFQKLDATTIYEYQLAKIYN